MPKTLKILKYPDVNLKKKSVEVDLSLGQRKYLKKFCADLAATMLKKDGVGLASPQVGRSIRLIVINTKDGVIALFNPKITKKSLTKEWGEEGCLSVPGIFGQVKRHKKIKCGYFDFDARLVKLEASGLFARVIQHEIDHLDGILFIDKAKNLKKIQKN